MASYPLLKNQLSMKWTCSAIYLLCAPSMRDKPLKFAKSLPQNWNLDIQFCQERNTELLKITSLLQSMIDLSSHPDSPKYRKKMEELLVLLDSDPRFDCIKMYPVTVDPRHKNGAPPKKENIPIGSDSPNSVATAAPDNNEGLSQESIPLFRSKSFMAWTCSVLNSLIPPAVLGNSSRFESLKPSSWKFDMAFCSDKRQQFVKINDLLRLLSDRNSNPAFQESQQEKAELLALLDSDPRFQCIKMNPVKSDPNQMSLKPGRTKTPVPQKNKTKTAPQKKVAAKRPGRPTRTVKGIDYDPEIEFGKGLKLVSGITEFSRDAKQIRIYIDEAWPHTLDKDYSDVGVISGIVWIGASPDYKLLPAISTHLRNTSTDTNFCSVISVLLQCKQAFPFAFPVFKSGVQEEDYPELLRIALITLLGWILPQDGNDCDVKIFCEGIGSARMEPGKNYADELKGMRNAMGLTADRMKRWHISEFISMKREDKEFEYIPYGDAIGYLTIPTQKARNWGNPIHVEDWPGYVPMSQDLLKILVNLDSDSPAGYADELFAFARDRQKTKLFSYVLNQAFRKAESNPEFKAALFEKLEKMFEDKERDLPLLDHLCKELSKRFPLDSYEGCPRQKLIRILVELQNANHAGDPERAKECVRLYTENRKLLLNEDFYLCAYTDMNLTVHYNDRFDFSSAAAICRNWENQSDFERLNRENQGRILSSIGQSYSISGDYGKAEEYFRRAIEIFRDPFNPLPDQADQTAVYLAMNALDAGNFDAAYTLAEEIFKCSFADAIAKYAGNTDKPFHHHLLVKNLYFNPKALSFRSAYLQLAEKWTGENQHPWELIEFYRILLLHDAGKTEASQKRVAALLEFYTELGGGAIMQLLKAFALTVFSLLEIDNGYGVELENLLNEVEKKLPAAAQVCQELRTAEHPDSDFWSILPFNYK